MKGIGLIVLCVAFACGLTARAQANACTPYQMVEKSDLTVPAGESFLYRIEKSGVPESYILGTFHTNGVDENWEMANLLFASLRVFVAETSFSPDSGKRFSELSNDPSEDLKSLLGESLLTAADPILAKYGIRASQTHLKPWALFLALAASPDRTASLDAFLASQAAQTMKLVGLQSADEMVASMERLTAADQLEILKETICNYSAVQDQTRRLETLYAHDDVAGFLRESERLSSPVSGMTEKLDRTLVADRNLIFMPRLQPILSAGGAFIAVGASHLYGEQGLLQGLRKQGFQVTAVNRRNFLQQLLVETNRSLSQPAPALLKWLKANMAVPQSYVPPKVQLAGSGALTRMGVCSQDCDAALFHGTIYVNVMHAQDLRRNDPQLLSLLLGYLIQDVQERAPGAGKSCTYWQQQSIQNLILRTKYLSSLGVPSAGLPFLPKADCEP